jgi:hypothetical protein
MEQWKAVDLLPGFFVSSIGRIKRVKDGVEFFRKIQIMKIGYPAINSYSTEVDSLKAVLISLKHKRRA